MIHISESVGDWDTSEYTVSLVAGLNKNAIQPNPRRYSMILSVPPSLTGIALTTRTGPPIDFNEGITLVWPDKFELHWNRHGPLVCLGYNVLCPAGFPPYLVVFELVQSPTAGER